MCIIRIENSGWHSRKELTMIIHDKNNYVDMMGRILEALGYSDIKRTGNDSIVSITAKKDGKVYAFACRYDIDAISGAVMEEFVKTAKKPGTDVLVFMTNSSFSLSAKKSGEAAGVELWDRNYIDRLTIGIDVRLEEPVYREEGHKKLYIAVAAAVVVVLAAALVLYFSPELFGLLG